MIIGIWAMDGHQLIGKGDQLPWKSREEFDHFRKQTLHADILMGARTFLGLKKPLADRHTYVLSDREMIVEDDNVTVVQNLEYLLSKYQKSSKILYVCGGASVYQQLWNRMDYLIVSIMKGTFEGDVYFPQVNWLQYRKIERSEYADFWLEKYERNDL